MISHDNAIVFQNVSKIYRLYQNQWQMVKDALGFSIRQTIPEFFALKNVNLSIKKGERIGLIGRNGAGKSTLLKLITQNFAPTSGVVSIHGRVQALMNTGVGFHPEFTGLENIKASLLYNGLAPEQFALAIDDVIDFVELGDFLNQPLKTYSLGMQSRLFFAVATAIAPEILIIDEVLGAGDAYFSAKSADRMKKLTQSGCTLILVSHSTQQVLQFCDNAYWLESGQIIMQGTALNVIKSYEEYTKKLELESMESGEAPPIKTQSVIQSTWLREKLLAEVLAHHDTTAISETEHQSPMHAGVSRWPSLEPGLKIHDIRLLNRHGKVIDKITANHFLDIEISIIAEEPGEYPIYFVILLFTEEGRWLTRHCSHQVTVRLEKNQIYSMHMHYDEVLLGNGKYLFSAAIYKTLNLNDLSTARYYDLLSRSFDFRVEGHCHDDTTLFNHPAQWIADNEVNHSLPELTEIIEV